MRLFYHGIHYLRTVYTDCEKSFKPNDTRMVSFMISVKMRTVTAPAEVVTRPTCIRVSTFTCAISHFQDRFRHFSISIGLPNHLSERSCVDLDSAWVRSFFQQSITLSLPGQIMIFNRQNVIECLDYNFYKIANFSWFLTIFKRVLC